MCADRTGRGAACEAELQADRQPAPPHPPDGHCHGAPMGARVTLGGHRPAPVLPAQGGGVLHGLGAQQVRGGLLLRLHSAAMARPPHLALPSRGQAQYGHPQDHGAPQPLCTLAGLGATPAAPTGSFPLWPCPQPRPPPRGQGQTPPEVRPTLSGGHNGSTEGCVGVGRQRPGSPRADSQAQSCAWEQSRASLKGVFKRISWSQDGATSCCLILSLESTQDLPGEGPSSAGQPSTPSPHSTTCSGCPGTMRGQVMGPASMGRRRDARVPMNACSHGQARPVMWAVMETEAVGVETVVKGVCGLLGVAVAVWKCHRGTPSQGWLT